MLFCDFFNSLFFFVCQFTRCDVYSNFDSINPFCMSLVTISRLYHFVFVTLLYVKEGGSVLNFAAADDIIQSLVETDLTSEKLKPH